MIMNLANILKIAYAASKVAETGGYLASGGQQNQLSNIAGTAGQVIGAASTVAGATGAGGAGGTADAATTPANPPANPTPKVPTPKVPAPKIGSTTTIGKPGSTGLPSMSKTADFSTSPSPQAGALKVNPGGYTKPNLQKAYLQGLEQSGAKLNKTGQIVKPDGQAFKKVGWDRKAQLMAMDPMRRQRMLAIDKSTVSAAKNKKGPVTNNTGRSVMDTEKPESPREQQPKSNKTVSKNLVIGTYPDGTPKSAKQIDKELGGISKTKSKTNPRLITAGPNKGMYTSNVDEKTGMEIYEENRYYVPPGALF